MRNTKRMRMFRGVVAMFLSMVTMVCLIATGSANEVEALGELITVWDHDGNPHTIRDGDIMAVEHDADGNYVETFILSGSNDSGFELVTPHTVFVDTVREIPPGHTITTMRYELQPNDSRRVHFTYRRAGSAGSATTAGRVRVDIYASSSISHNPAQDRRFMWRDFNTTLSYPQLSSGNFVGMGGMPCNRELIGGLFTHVGLPFYFARYTNTGNRNLRLQLHIQRHVCR